MSKIIKLCSASRMTFRAWFYRTDSQNIGGQFGTLSGFLRNTFRKRTSQKKSPEIYFRPKSFRTIFDKRTPVYSFAAPLLGLAKSIYYYVAQHFNDKNLFCYHNQNLLDAEILVFLCTVIRLGSTTGQDRWLHLLVTQDTTWRDLQTDCAWKMEIGARSFQHVRK